MVEGQICRINRDERTAVIKTNDGREVNVQFGADAHFEVYEPATGGLQGGTLDDIGEGYLVRMEEHQLVADGSHDCLSLVSIS